jgi:assimilatory nitrate reductase catalytic subunit
MTETQIRTTCPYCGVGCGVIATPSGPVNSGIAGDKAHPANFGRLCSKGSALGETLSLDGRLLHPEINGQRVSWDAALDEVASRFADTIAKHGPDSVALYVSGQLLTEDYYAANKFTKGFLGTANIDSNSRLCMSSAVAGHKRAFGEDVVPAVYEDLELADLVILVGSNTAWCHPVLYQRLLAAREARPGTKLVVIDPRRTASCEGADLHLPLRPGTDVALFNFLLGQLAQDPLNEAVQAARASSPDLATTAALCGVAEADLALLLEWFAATPRALTLFSQGVNQSSAGTDKVNAIINLHVATGRIGLPGAGPFSLTGQPNAMGGREVGALSNLLAGHLEWDQPGHVDLVRAYWDAPNMATQPGRKAVDLFRAIGDKTIKAVWIIATNPAISMPEAASVREALRGCETVVISEAMREQDSVDLAHIRLPALAWGEKDGTVTNSERVMSRQRAFLPAAGEARADWWIIAQVAARMGWARQFAWKNPAEIFREHARLSGLANNGRRLFDISGLAGKTDADYAAMEPTRWPVPISGESTPRFFPAGIGAKLVPTPFREAARSPSSDFPLVLNTGRIRDQWHTMTRTGKAPRLSAHLPEPYLSIHPDDAGGIEEGALVRLDAVTGHAILRARLDPGQRPGSVFAPMHWTRQFCPEGRINQSVNAEVDPISGQPELKHTPVRISPWTAEWHGFLISRERLGADVVEWCAIIPTGAAWRHEIAGTEPADGEFARLRGMVPQDGAWITLSDPASGVHRAALVQDGTLQAVIFLGPGHLLPARDWLVSLFERDRITLDERRALLAGLPAEGGAPEKPVCVCFGVGESRIRAAIDGGCGTVEAIGAATHAGTNCGSCKPELRALLASVPA